MDNIMHKHWTISALLLTLVLGCQSVPNEENASDSTAQSDSAADTKATPKFNDKEDRKAKSVQSRKWQLIQIDGFDASQSTYQQFTLSFNGKSMSAKAFNTFTLPVVNMADNGVLSFSGTGISTKVGVPDPKKSALEKAYFNRIQSAKLWRVLRRQLIIGSGKNKLVFIRMD